MSVNSLTSDSQEQPKPLATAMKITPTGIRQHTFEKGLRGYKVEEVDAFLSSLSEEWERLTSDYKMIRMQLELAEKELSKLKEVEMTLFRTLKTAEDTSTQITDQASKAGEKYIGEARQKADELLADARKRSVLMVQDAENQSRYLKDNILNDLKSLEHDFKALENYKENLAVQIRTLAGNAVDSVERFEKKFTKQNLKGKIDEAALQIKDDLGQADGKSAAPAKNPVEFRHRAAFSTNPVADLPPLTQRENAVPEAIPVDESLLVKLTEAIQPSVQSQPVQIVQAPAVDETKAEPVASESVPFPVDPVPSEPTPTDNLVEERQPAKGGSFFDQI